MQSSQIDQLLQALSKGELKVSLYTMSLPSALQSLYESFSASSAAPAALEGAIVTPAAKGCSCRCCGLAFSSVVEQQTHYKTAAHVLVLRRSLPHRQVGSIGAPEAADDDGGIAEEENGGSGSSSDSFDETESVNLGESAASTFDDGVARRVFGRDGPQYSLDASSATQALYEMLVPAALVDSCSCSDEGDDSRTNPSLKVGRCISTIRASSKLWAVFILRSGKFAGAVFDCGVISSSSGSCQEAEPLVHKVIKRYTVRACAGGSQSAHDNQGRNAKSAGAMLRRYNEQALKEDIRALLRLWSSHIDTCFRIAVSASKTMRGVLLDDDDGSTLLSKSDPRLLYAPFMVRDVTFDQTKSVLARCTQVTFRAHPRDAAAAAAPAPALPVVPASAPKVAAAAATAIVASVDTSRRILTAIDEPRALSLLQAVRRGDLDDVQSALLAASVHPSGAAYVLALPEDEQMMLTPLHIAAEEGLADIVSALLLGGSPIERVDARGRYPYFLSKDKATRDAFRRYRGVAGEDRHDYERAGVPPAMTAEGEQQRAAREKEKKKKQQQRKKEQKAREEKDRAEAERMLQRQLLQEQQRKEQEQLSAGSCEVCSTSLYAQKLSVFDRSVCSSACVATLRRRLAADAAEARFKRK